MVKAYEFSVKTELSRCHIYHSPKVISTIFFFLFSFGGVGCYDQLKSENSGKKPPMLFMEGGG